MKYSLHNESRIRASSANSAFDINLIKSEPDTRALLAKADLVRSAGPWLVIDSTRVMFDAIDAGCGLGFNAGPLFGVAQFAGAWTNDWNDIEVQGVHHALEKLVARKPHLQNDATRFSDPSDLIRTYIATNVLDQFEDSAHQLQASIRRVFEETARETLGPSAGDFLNQFDGTGRSFRVNFRMDNTHAISQLLRLGVVAELKHQGPIEFRVPLSATPADIKILARRIQAVWSDQEAPDVEVELRDTARYYHFHSQLLMRKLANLRSPFSTIDNVIESLNDSLPHELRSSGRLVFLSSKNWQEFREPVELLQKAVYEPVRQTSLKTFDALFGDPFGFGLVVEVDGQIAGLAAAGPLGIFPGERGTSEDPQSGDRHTLYPLDLTVAPNYRGALGSYLKSAMVLIATASGHHAFHGRNRDRMAAAMWAINLSLGSYQIRHLVDDYPDTLPFRDCIYYRCPLQWPAGSQDIAFNEGAKAEQIARMIH